MSLTNMAPVLHVTLNVTRGLFWLFLAALLTGQSHSALVDHCDFERDLCNWTQPAWDDGNWTRLAGPTSTDNTGPQWAMPYYGGTYYIYLEASDFQDKNGSVVVLLTPELTRVECVAFLYMKYGRMMGVLRVGSYKNGTKIVLWEKDGETTRDWLCQIINVSRLESTQIYFEATAGHTILGDIALDSVYIFSEQCSTTTNCTNYLNELAQVSTTTIAITTSVKSEDTTSQSPSETTTRPTTPYTSSPSSTSVPWESTTEGLSDTDFLFAVIVPAVVLVVAAVVAVVYYKRRQARRAEKMRSQMSLGTNSTTDGEVYDVLDETAMSPNNKADARSTRHCQAPTSDPYDIIGNNDVKMNTRRGSGAGSY